MGVGTMDDQQGVPWKRPIQQNKSESPMDRPVLSQQNTGFQQNPGINPQNQHFYPGQRVVNPQQQYVQRPAQPVQQPVQSQPVVPEFSKRKLLVLKVLWGCVIVLTFVLLASAIYYFGKYEFKWF